MSIGTMRNCVVLILAFAFCDCNIYGEISEQDVIAPVDKENIDVAKMSLKGAGLPRTGQCNNQVVRREYGFPNEINFLPRGRWIYQDIQFIYCIKSNPCWVSFHSEVNTEWVCREKGDQLCGSDNFQAVLRGKNESLRSCGRNRQKLEVLIPTRLRGVFLRNGVLSVYEMANYFWVWAYYNQNQFCPADSPAQSPPAQPIECQNDVPAGTPLPHEFNSNLTVVARDSTGLHVVGNEADQYFFTQFYADPNPANLLAVWVQGNWNGFSMGFEIPFGYNKFTPAKQQGANFLSAGGVNTRVADGVQVINGGFALTCGNRISNEQMLTEVDMVHYPVECVRDVDLNDLLPQSLRPELVVLTRRWGLHVIGHEAEQYRFCQWYADPNPANLPAIWNNGTWDGTSMYFEEPYGYNKFTPAKQQGQDFLPASDVNTRVSQGVQIINQGFAYTCGQRTSDEQVLSDRDYLPVIQPPVEEPDHQGLYLERSDNQIVMANGERWPYILWWAVPNPNNLTSVWLQGSFDGNYTYFDIPQERNHFVIAETNANTRPEQFYPVGSYEAELGDDIRIVGTDFEIDL